jgi:hypothetical protein
MDTNDKDPKDSNDSANRRDNGEHSKGRRKEPNMSWLTWAVISTVLALLVAAGGYLLYRRLTRGMRVIAENSCPVAGVRYIVRDELGNVTEGFTGNIPS